MFSLLVGNVASFGYAESSRKKAGIDPSVVYPAEFMQSELEPGEACFSDSDYIYKNSVACSLDSVESTLGLLKMGNLRFVEGKAQHPHQDIKRRHDLSSGQKPHSIVLSCSDSRVPPEMVFDQGLGDIFTVRVAGNILDTAAVASIEYAVEHLGARLIVVMGHESCGAVKAALNTAAGQSAGSAHLDSLILSIQKNLGDHGGFHEPADPTIRRPVMKNVDTVSRKLIEQSHIVRHYVEAGEVKIVPAIYGLHSGVVEFF